jgi:glycosyltransferase involved in cell wall biosynthesis
LERAGRKTALAFRRGLVPDENVTWNLTAIPAAIRIVRREQIDVVITTSPPTSVHLIGAAVRRATGARWIADLRDSIVANPHRRTESALVRAKERTGQSVARRVARSADAVVAVSEPIADELRALGAGRVETIPNGCDFEDFAGLEYRPSERLRLTHTGSFFGRRSPRPILEALAGSDVDASLRFVGDFRAADREWAAGLGLEDRLELHPYLPRREVLAMQKDSEALLLLIPESGGRGRGVLSAKVFEYLAAERPILAAVPPDGAAADLIRETGTGTVVAPDDVDGLRAALVQLETDYRGGRLNGTPLAPELRDRLSRRKRTEELAELIRSLA